MFFTSNSLLFVHYVSLSEIKDITSRTYEPDSHATEDKCFHRKPPEPPNFHFSLIYLFLKLIFSKLT
jgi:hypothetical protein